MDFEYMMNSDQYHCKIKIKSKQLTEEESFVIENWLMTDITVPERIIEMFYLALNKEDGYEKNWIGGNSFWWKLGKEYTQIEYQYEESFEDGKSPFKPCKISTQLLYEILKIWAIEYKKWQVEQEDF